MPDAEEPTPGVGPCIEDIGLVKENIARELHVMLEPTEYNVVDLLVPSRELEVFLRVFIGLDCLHALEIHIRGCGKLVGKVKKLYEEPEFSRVILEGDCMEIVAPADPSLRLVRALRLAGIEAPVEPVAYRVVNKFVLD